MRTDYLQTDPRLTFYVLARCPVIIHKEPGHIDDYGYDHHYTSDLDDNNTAIYKDNQSNGACHSKAPPPRRTANDDNEWGIDSVSLWNPTCTV